MRPCARAVFVCVGILLFFRWGAFRKLKGGKPLPRASGWGYAAMSQSATLLTTLLERLAGGWRAAFISQSARLYKLALVPARRAGK
jgi:hypothetical protein